MKDNALIRRCSLQNLKSAKMIYAVTIAALLGIAAYLLFYQLGAHYVLSYDEASHGINAYEMWKSKNYVLHTYQWQPDYYNLKPPLSYLAYHIVLSNLWLYKFCAAFSKRALHVADVGLSHSLDKKAAWFVCKRLRVVVNGCQLRTHFEPWRTNRRCGSVILIAECHRNACHD